MKKLVISLIALASIANAGGMWDMVKNSNMPEVKTTGYVVQVKGVDARAYTFKPKDTKDIKCVVMFNENFMQLNCFPQKGM